MSFDRNSYAFILYTVTVYTTVHKSLPHPQKRTEPIFLVKEWMFETKIKLLISLGLCWNQCRNIEKNVVLSILKLPSQQGWAPRSFPFRTFQSFPFKKEKVTFFSVLFSSFWRLMKPKRTLRSFPFFSILLIRTEKNGKNETFFYKERKRTRRT